MSKILVIDVTENENLSLSVGLCSAVVVLKWYSFLKVNGNMKNIINEIKLLHPSAKVPAHGNDRAMGYDICCIAGTDGLPGDHKFSPEQVKAWADFEQTGEVRIYSGESFLFRTGISIAIEPGHGCLLWDRSGNGAMKLIGKLAGVIDEDYRGEWFVRLVNHNDFGYVIFKPGDKIVQGIFQERIVASFVIVDKLPPSDRGVKWAGSTDGNP